MAFLEQQLAQEKADRIQSLADQLAPINADITQNNTELDLERNDRVVNERLILENLASDARKIEDAIMQEQAERREMQNEIVEVLDNELER